MRGNMVITSNEGKVIKGNMVIRKIEPAGNYILWTFSDEDAAYRAVKIFINSGFEFVRRLI
jgi:hypothetical protein